MFILPIFLFSVLVVYNVHGYCEDWTLCQRVDCAPPLNPCTEDKPHLLFDDCGCCQYCSDSPRVGLCGTCNVDVKCKHFNPICNKANHTISLDYCGCCRVCKEILGDGQECVREGISFSVCDEGLRCINDTCTGGFLIN